MYRMKRRKVIEEGFADCGSNEEFEYAPWEGSGPWKQGRSGGRQCVFSDQTRKVTAMLYHPTCMSYTLCCNVCLTCTHGHSHAPIPHICCSCLLCEEISLYNAEKPSIGALRLIQVVYSFDSPPQS